MAHRPPRATKQKALEGFHLMEEDSSNEDNLGPQRAFARHMAESVSSGPATEPLLDMDMSSADMSFEMDRDESNLDSARSGGESERGASRGARGRGARSGARGRGARRGGRRQYNPPLASVEERHRVQRLRDDRVNRIKELIDEMREEEAKALLLKVETLFLTHKANTKDQHIGWDWWHSGQKTEPPRISL
ncbi:unnamed protein product [Gadus morhua 'NCC']